MPCLANGNNTRAVLVSEREMKQYVLHGMQAETLVLLRHLRANALQGAERLSLGPAFNRGAQRSNSIVRSESAEHNDGVHLNLRELGE